MATNETEEYFAPATCDEHGNTYYPYIVKGIITPDGMSIKLSAPADFIEKWPSVATSYMARTKDQNPRRLTHAEVLAICKQQKVCVRQEIGCMNERGQSFPRA